jgi:hypothetical protein
MRAKRFRGLLPYEMDICICLQIYHRAAAQYKQDHALHAGGASSHFRDFQAASVAFASPAVRSRY